MTFREQLLAARDERHSRNHPFVDKFARGELTKAQTAVYLVQHHHYVSAFFDWILYAASKTTSREAKLYLLQNLSEEEDPRDSHTTMLFDYLAACGVSETEARATPILFWTNAIRDWGWRTVLFEPWPVALAGFLVGLESQPPGINERIVPALEQHYGWPRGTHAIRFFEHHIEADVVHAARGLEIVEAHCDTQELRDRAIACVRAAVYQRWEYMNGVYWKALHGRDDTTPPFP
jgi:pyrroloquinoline quinone (PQQ) biosynthesis protein C